MRRRLLRLFLGLFALLQGISPLLHAHVLPPTGGQTGLHVHAVPIAPAREPGQSASLTFAALPEPAAITAPAEHRRDEPLGNLAQPGIARSQPPIGASADTSRAPALPAGAPVRALALRIPPAQGPPAALRCA
jgi:hypothetical protein